MRTLLLALLVAPAPALACAMRYEPPQVVQAAPKAANLAALMTQVDAAKTPAAPVQPAPAAQVPAAPAAETAPTTIPEATPPGT